MEPAEATPITEPSRKPIVRRKKRKVRRSKAPRNVVASKDIRSPYQGLSATKCADACKPDCCVITQADACGRTPLQYPYSADSGCITRRNEARAYLQHQAVDKKANRNA